MIKINKKVTFLVLLTLTVLLATAVVSATDSNTTTDSSSSNSIDDSSASVSETSSSDTNEVKSINDSSSHTKEVKTSNNEVKSTQDNSVSQNSAISTDSDSNSQKINSETSNMQTNQTTKNSNSSHTSISNKEVTANEDKIQTSSNDITNQNNNINSANIVSDKSLSSSTITKSVNNYNELYNAVEEAKTSSATEYTINLEVGNYNCTSVITWGDSVTTKNLTINGNGQTINGSNTCSFICVSNGYSLNLNNITLTNFMNDTDYTRETYYAGGAINVGTGNLTVNNTTFKNNYGYSGGAIRSYNSNITITNSFFTDNSAMKIGGGAISSEYSKLNISNTSFINDSKYAIYCDNTNLTISDSLFNSNYGAIKISYNKFNSSISNTVFINNTADSGGSISNFENNLTIKNSSFINNTADSDGGAIYNDNLGNVSIQDSIFTGNYALSGGAINNNLYSKMTVCNCTFIENNSWNSSDAIYNSGSLNLTNNNFTYDKPVYGAVYVYNTNSSFYMYNNTMTIATINGTAPYHANVYSPIVDTTLSNPEKIIFKIYDSSGQCEDVNAEELNSYIILDYTFHKDSYTIKIDYDYFSNYNNNNIYFFAEFNKTQTSILIDEIDNPIIGKTINITGTLEESDGNPIPNANIEISINEHNYQIMTNSNGKFNYSYLITTSGTYTIILTFNGYDEFLSTSNYITLNVPKTSTIITLDPIEDQVIGNYITISGTLKNTDGDYITNTLLFAYLNDWRISLGTDSNGEFKSEVMVATAGINNLTVKIDENDDFYSSNASTSFYVSKINPTIEIVNPISDTQVGNNVTISAFISDNSNILKSRQLIFNINGNTSKVYSDEYGTFTYTFKTTITGVNNITITFEEEDWYYQTSITTTFNVTKINTKLNVSSIDYAYVNNPVTIFGQLVGDNENYPNHVNVTIIINQDEYKAETRSKGNYSLEFIPTAVGTYYITISFDGNSNYTASTIQTSFEVLKEASNIKIDQVTTKNGYNVTFKATITDEDGNPINSGQATFKLNGVTLKVNGSQVKVNVTNGLAQYTYTVPNYSAKEYKLTVVYGLTDVRLEDSTTLVILKSDPELKLTSITSDGTTGHITGMLLDEHGVGVDRETKVSVKINGKTILSTRIYEGVIDLEFDTSAYKNGIHNLTVIFGENGCYNTVTYEGVIAQNVKDTIVVNPVTGKNGDVVSFRAYIIDENGNSATNGSATFKLNGVTVKENGTQIKVNFVNGVAEYNFTIPDYSAKDYNLTAVASIGTTRYEAQSILTIEKTDTHVQLNPITITQGSNATVTGSILDEHNNPITIDTKVSVKINGKTVSNTRVYDGLIDVPIDTSSYSKGNYTIDFVAGENGRYNKSTGSTTLTIN